MTVLDLIFDPEKHRYFLPDGERLFSVSEIKAPASPDFSMVSPEIMLAAQNWGHAVHKMVELYLSETLDLSTLDDPLFGPLEALERWLSEVKPFRSGPALIDVKSRPYDRVADPVQIAAYNQLVIENEITEITIEQPMASIKHRYAGTPDIIIPGEGPPNWRILYLGRDGKYTYTPCYDPNAWPIFGRLLTDFHRKRETEQLLHSWRNRK